MEREGRVPLPKEGGTLNLGSGEYNLHIQCGSDLADFSETVTVQAKDQRLVEFPVRPLFDAGNYVLVSTQWPDDRSSDWHGTQLDALSLAASEGLSYIVAAPLADVASMDTSASQEVGLLSQKGGTVTSVDDWSITAWPMVEKTKYGGHGMPDIRFLSPEDALTVMHGGPGKNRFTAVDLAWLEAAPPFWDITAIRPDFVRLEDPGPTGPDPGIWSPWFNWLDAGAALIPLGPKTWVPVIDPDHMSHIDVEVPLLRGNVIATTGPLLTLSINGVPPGEVMEPTTIQNRPIDAPHAHIRIVNRENIHHVALIGNGGALLQEWSVGGADWEVSTMIYADTSWVVAAMWSESSSQWAVTGPIWIRPPGT
jgi:hypothetical protein